jgi:hypothetical protein
MIYGGDGMPAGGAKRKSAAGGGGASAAPIEEESKLGYALDGEENLEERGHLPGERTGRDGIREQFPGIDDDTVEDLFRATTGFSNGFDYYINNAQRAWINGETLTPWGEMALNRAAWLESYIEKSPKYTSKRTLYRGMSDSEGLYDHFMNAKAGDIFRPKQLTSASSDEWRATNFMKGDRGIMLEIKGPHSTGASLKHLSDFAHEKEVLFSARTTFKIISKTVDAAGHLRVKVKVDAPDKEITQKLRGLNRKRIDASKEYSILDQMKSGSNPKGLDSIVRKKAA